MTNNCNLEKSVPPLVKKIVDPLPRLKMHNPLGNVHSNILQQYKILLWAKYLERWQILQLYFLTKCKKYCHYFNLFCS